MRVGSGNFLFFNNENILFDCPESGFATEMDTAFINFDFRSISDPRSEHPTFTPSSIKALHNELEPAVNIRILAEASKHC